MAKKTAKETSMPLVIALVFFVLTTITFGVLWYMQYSDQQAKDDAVKKANDEKKAAAGETADAQRELQMVRLMIGIEDEKDRESVASETKRDKITTKAKRYNESLAKALGVEDPSRIQDEYKPAMWQIDDKGTATEAPLKGFLPVLSKAIAERNAAKEHEAKVTADYQAEVAKIKAAITTVEEIKKKFDDVASALPKKFEADLKAFTQKFDALTNAYKKNEADFRAANETLVEEKTRAEHSFEKANTQLKTATEEINRLVKDIVKKQDTFQYDEPQGKILRRLSDNVVEINLGSEVLVKQGLTFSVLPSDYPEKGRQSRMRVYRMPNDKGSYVNVERFEEKGTIEVIEVLGAKLSRCRITGEPQPIRDAIGPGDLLYNSVWRKGTTDHVALIGIFDINGDGSDDIEIVVRDLQKMGIPVDAYFDLKTRRWKGQVDAQTRYIIQGYSPVTLSANDPKKDEKTKIIGAINDAIKVAQAKGGAPTVNFRDFFPRMGYRVKLDISTEKINQAASPYYQSVLSVDQPPMP